MVGSAIELTGSIVPCHADNLHLMKPLVRLTTTLLIYTQGEAGFGLMRHLVMAHRLKRLARMPKEISSTYCWKHKLLISIGPQIFRARS